MLLTSSFDIVFCGLSRCKHHENYFETWISVHDVVLWRSMHVSSSERPLMFFLAYTRMDFQCNSLAYDSPMDSTAFIALAHVIPTCSHPNKKTKIDYVLVAQQHVAVIEMQGTLAARLLQPWH